MNKYKVTVQVTSKYVFEIRAASWAEADDILEGMPADEIASEGKLVYEEVSYGFTQLVCEEE